MSNASLLLYSPIINLLRIHIMFRQPVPRDFLPRRPALPIVTIRIYGKSSAREELPRDLDILRIEKGNQILHDLIDAVLMKISVISVREQIQLQTFALHHQLIRHIRNVYRGEIRLSRDGAQAGELRTIELHEIIIVRVLIGECFQK